MTNDTIRTVDDLVNDPLIRQVMTSYGVTPGHVRGLFEAARERAEELAFVPPAHVIKAQCCKHIGC